MNDDEKVQAIREGDEIHLAHPVALHVKKLMRGKLRADVNNEALQGNIKCIIHQSDLPGIGERK